MYQRTAYLGVAVALALVVSYVESMIPFSMAIPGIKLGLTNVVIVYILYKRDTKSAFLVSVLRIVLAGMLFGSMASILYSIAGGMSSLFGMMCLKRWNGFSIIGVSIVGGVLHNMGQLIIAMLVVENLKLFYYAPVLLVAGLVTGIAIGLLAKELQKRI